MKRKRVGAIDDNLDEKIDHREYVKNRDFVYQAMEADHDIAKRLRYLIEEGKVTTKVSKRVKQDLLPPCCNKFGLLRKERLQQVLAALERKKYTTAVTSNMEIDEMRNGLCFALFAKKTCNLMSKNFPDLLERATSRYEKLNRRLRDIPLTQLPNGKYVHKWATHGCFKLMLSEGQDTYDRVAHPLTGIVIPLTDPLALHFHITMNWSEGDATVESPQSANCFKVERIYQLAKK